MYYTDDYEVFSNRGRSYGPPSFKAEHAIGVINLARLTGEHSLLPVAFLICCTLGKDNIRGFQREDGSLEQLALDDIALCFEARGKLVARRAAATLYVFVYETGGACEEPDRCPKAWSNLLINLTANELFNPDPFDSVFQAHKHKLEKAVCPYCWLLLQEYEQKQLSLIWDELPLFFDLQPVV